MRAPREARASLRAHPGARRLRLAGGDERGDLVLAWLLKLAVTLSLVGLLAFDLVSVVVAKVGVQDDASLAARRASDAAERGASVQQAYDAAAEALADQGSPSVVETSTFRLGRDGTAEVSTVRTPTTYLFHYVGLLDDWLEARATATAAPVR